MNLSHEVKVYWKHKKKDEYWVNKLLKKRKTPLPKGGMDDFAGLVTSFEFKEDIPMFVSDDILEANNMMVAGAFLMSVSGNDHIMIVLEKEYYHHLMNDERLEAGIDHELGHICCGHLVEGSIYAQIAKNRGVLQKEGIVPETEIEADRFAARRCGKENIIYYLQYVLKSVDKCKEARQMPEDEYLAVKQEVINRIKLLETLD